MSKLIDIFIVTGIIGIGLVGRQSSLASQLSARSVSYDRSA
ncbi:MAG: hypothetical protein SGJ11_02300 [Phycisphaerae bacterium]|nr:hypothetical protein [Phycisphaerae bacterium]